MLYVEVGHDTSSCVSTAALQSLGHEGGGGWVEQQSLLLVLFYREIRSPSRIVKKISWVWL